MELGDDNEVLGLKAGTLTRGDDRGEEEEREAVAGSSEVVGPRRPRELGWDGIRGDSPSPAVPPRRHLVPGAGGGLALPLPPK